MASVGIAVKRKRERERVLCSEQLNKPQCETAGLVRDSVSNIAGWITVELAKLIASIAMAARAVAGQIGFQTGKRMKKGE